MSSGLVDILLATYNGARHLEQQLDSILAQTRAHWRLLVSDDGSTDETLAIVERYRAKAPDKIVLVPHPGAGSGLIRNFENLMAQSLRDGIADWVAFSDQDDVWLPEKIERSVAAMRQVESESGVDVPCLIHTDLVVVDQDLAVIAESFARYQRMAPAQASPVSLLSVNQVTGCTMVVNRALLALALPLPPQVLMHDWWCALLSGSGRRLFVDSPLILYRQHGSNQVGARNRSLHTRLTRLLQDGAGVWRRVRALGRGTYLQALALQQRLRRGGWSDGYVEEYLAWRQGHFFVRLARYRHYYCGPELDRMSRCLLWNETPLGGVDER